jgi:hypothetical protein
MADDAQNLLINNNKQKQNEHVAVNDEILIDNPIYASIGTSL